MTVREMMIYSSILPVLYGLNVIGNASAFTIPSSAADRQSLNHITSGRVNRKSSLLYVNKSDDKGDELLSELSIEETANEDTNACQSNEFSRRNTLKSLIATSVALGSAIATSESSSAVANAVELPSFFPSSSGSGLDYKPAPRPLSYLVDSTIPPTLLPIKGAVREATILKKLGQGVGTAKTPFLQERLNLNNMMKKGVDGIVTATSGGTGDMQRMKKPGYASFVFLGVDYADSQDTSLANTLISQMIQVRKATDDTALGLEFCPQSLQSKLDQYTSGSIGDSDLVEVMVQAGVDRTVIETQLPLLEFAKNKKIYLLALAPEPEDVKIVLTQGLQNVDPDRRSKYVVDPQGFIEQTQDPYFKLYTEKSLLRNYETIQTNNSNDSTAASPSTTVKASDFFAERILYHEAVATVAAQYAVLRPNSLVITLAPIRDVRYMGGPNGRVNRISHVLSPECSIDEQSITTILLNPSAEETLSKSKFLRLEIGTSPDNRMYQTKIADYLWFSTMPKVNMLPRLMNGI